MQIHWEKFRHAASFPRFNLYSPLLTTETQIYVQVHWYHTTHEKNRKLSITLHIKCRSLCFMMLTCTEYIDTRISI